MNNRILCLLLLVVLCNCNRMGASSELNGDHEKGGIIIDPIVQDSIFHNLMELTNYSIKDSKRNDSLAFLILPVEASCPSCRKKTIDSIDQYKNKLDDNHFVIISGPGRKKINYYYSEQRKGIPESVKNIYLDSMNLAVYKDLVFANPRIYYSNNGKVYEKVSCRPSTIKNDLRIFFSN